MILLATHRLLDLRRRALPRRRHYGPPSLLRRRPRPHAPRAARHRRLPLTPRQRRGGVDLERPRRDAHLLWRQRPVARRHLVVVVLECRRRLCALGLVELGRCRLECAQGQAPCFDGRAPHGRGRRGRRRHRRRLGGRLEHECEAPPAAQEGWRRPAARCGRRRCGRAQGSGRRRGSGGADERGGHDGGGDRGELEGEQLGDERRWWELGRRCRERSGASSTSLALLVSRAGCPACGRVADPVLHVAQQHSQSRAAQSEEDEFQRALQASLAEAGGAQAASEEPEEDSPSLEELRRRRAARFG